MSASPSEEYARRLADREARVAAFERLHVRAGNVRLLLAIAIAVVGWASIARHAFSFWWLLLPTMCFIAVGLYHTRVMRGRAQAERAVAVYCQGQARIEDRLQGTGRGRERLDIPHHVYATDLDLFGRGSLFELLSTARTTMGQETLAGWLLSPSAVDQIAKRHIAIAELRDQLDLREDLAILGEDARVGVFSEELLRWAEAPNQ